MPYIGNVVVDFNVDTDNINNSAVTAVKLSPSVGSNGQVLSVDANGALQWTTDAAGMPTSGGTFTGNVLFNDDVKHVLDMMMVEVVEMLTAYKVNFGGMRRITISTLD